VSATRRWRGAGIGAAGFRGLVLAACLGAVLVLPARAGLISIHEPHDGFAPEPHYGEVIREIRITGNRHTEESVIRGALCSRVGEVYTAEKARLDMLWISRMGAFTSVSFAVDEVTDGIAVTVAVTEATPYVPSLSFALTEENGVEIGPAVSSANLFKRAARASLYARFGGATNVGLRYADPQVPGTLGRTTYRLEYFHRERTNKLLDFSEDTNEALMEFKWGLQENLRNGLRLRYLGLGADRAGITLAGGRDRIPAAGYFLEYDTRNDIYPTSGWFLDGEIARWGLLGNGARYWRCDLDVRRYVPLSPLGPRHSLALYSFATLVGGTLGETVPYHQEFFIGGTNSVRGWSLGARQGRDQWLNTVEYWYELMEQKIWKIWFVQVRMGFQLGAFYDVGTAWSTPEEMDRNWIGGGGAGFRLTLPIVTVVRFDAAWGEQGPGLRFFIGGGEKAAAQKLRVR